MDKRLKSVLLIALGIVVLVSGSTILRPMAELCQVAPVEPVVILAWRCLMTGLYLGGLLALAGWETEE